MENGELLEDISAMRRLQKNHEVDAKKLIERVERLEQNLRRRGINPGPGIQLSSGKAIGRVALKASGGGGGASETFILGKDATEYGAPRDSVSRDEDEDEDLFDDFMDDGGGDFLGEDQPVTYDEYLAPAPQARTSIHFFFHFFFIHL